MRIDPSRIQTISFEVIESEWDLTGPGPVIDLESQDLTGAVSRHGAGPRLAIATGCRGLHDRGELIGRVIDRERVSPEPMGMGPGPPPRHDPLARGLL